MRIFITAFLLLSTLLGKAQKTDSIYDFINQFFSKEKESVYITDEPDFSMIIEHLSVTDSIDQFSYKIKSPITAEDSIKISQQIKKLTQFRLQESKLQNAKVISTKHIHELFTENEIEAGWAKIRKSGIEHGFYSISIPIFFDDGHKAIFYYGFHCGGLCGSGGVSVYEYKNGKWEEICSLVDWIS